jgi:hypothetical protein
MMATAAAPKSAPRGSGSGSRWRLPGMPQFSWRLAALAALVLLAVGYAGVEISAYVGEFFPRQFAAPTPSKFKASFASSLVATHDNCARMTDHHLMPGDDFASLKARLSREEGVNVFAAALNGGWQFRGAGLCKVGQTKAAHLLYARGFETASVFTLPSDDSVCSMSSVYAQTEANHAIAAVSRGGALYVVVITNAGSSDVPVKDAETVLDTIEGACPGSCVVPSDNTNAPATGPANGA